MALSFCTLGSGSKGNCYLVAGPKSRILVDAGLSAKTICGYLCELGVNPGALSGIVVTHEHIDHIAGIRVLANKFGIPVYANEKTMGEILRKTKELDRHLVRVFENGTDFFINEMNIMPFKTPHDSVSSVGFSIYCGANKVTVATDIGHMTRTILEEARQSDLLVLEANHDLQMLLNGPYPERLKQRVQGMNGHLSNELCAKTLAYLLDEGLKQVILAHLSEENNRPEIAMETVCNALQERGAVIGKDVCVDVAAQYQRGKCYQLI